MSYVVRNGRIKSRQHLHYLFGGLLIFFMFITWIKSFHWNEIDPLQFRLVTSKKVVGNESKVNTNNNHTISHGRLKYVLLWTSPERDPLRYLGEGRKVFQKNKCSVTNCYVTTNKTFFANITNYDAILLHGPEIYKNQYVELPATRSPHQLFVFASMESADRHPICTNKFDNYFNLTWTYKLNSDIFFGYIMIKNETGDIIGPNQIMHWKKLEDMEPADNRTKEKLQPKITAGAWFVSNCKAPSGRDQFVRQVQNELDRYKLSVDIFGKCGNKTCPRGDMASCLNKIERDYYFYFSFENSFADDYVTEKLLHALNHYAVPVVYGSANYTRFLPDGSYLNALKLGAKELAKQMFEIINDKERYYSFFKWRNHYSYNRIEDSAETNPYCNLCKKINNEKVLKSTKSYNLKKWWNPKKIRPNICRKT